MQTKLLRSFLSVARHRNFSAAAREMNTVQPAISRQIAELEAQLGTQLFWRSTRSVKTTTQGDVLVQQAEEILDLVDRSQRMVERAARGELGRLRIGYLSSACISFIPHIVQMFVAEFPDVQIELRELNVSQQLKAFEEGKLDISFTRPPTTQLSSTVARDLLHNDQLVCYLPSNHVYADRSELELRHLSKEKFVFFERQSATGLFDKIIATCQNAGFSPMISHQTNSMQTLLTEVASGLGVALAPACVAGLNMAGCVKVPLDAKETLIPLEMHYLSDPLDILVENFVTLVNINKALLRYKALGE